MLIKQRVTGGKSPAASQPAENRGFGHFLISRVLCLRQRTRVVERFVVTVQRRSHLNRIYINAPDHLRSSVVPMYAFEFLNRWIDAARLVCSEPR